MLHFDKEALQNLDRILRLNFVNSVTGIKPANLIGTASASGQTNLAIFSSVVHLGSNPALLGMMVRPAGEVARHTYENIRATGVYTINAVPAEWVRQAHYTSAKFGADESEFAACGFTEEYCDGFSAPYVAESPLKMGLRLAEEVPVRLNNTVLLVGYLEHIYLAETMLDDQYLLDLSAADIAGIGGLNAYYRLEKIGMLPYAMPGALPEFEK